MPALTQFVDGTGPIFAGKVFPFVFITIACGAISGFHALVSSGTTPKLDRQRGRHPPRRLRQHGDRIVRRHHGGDRRDAARSGRVLRHQRRPRRRSAATAGSARCRPSRAGASRSRSSRCRRWRDGWAKARCSRRTGGAPSLAVGMASIFGSAFGAGPAEPLVPLRHHVRGDLHPDDGRCGHARRPLHAAGRARPGLGADGPHVVVSLGADLEHARRRRAGVTSSTSASSIRTAASTSCGRCSASRTRCSRPSRCRWRPAS